jgi:hypothetical protein
MRNLRGIYIKWSTLTDIDSLASLGQLRYLYIGQSTRVRSIQVLGHLAGLEWLELENLKRIRDVAPLGRLVGLQGLALTGGIASNWHLRTLTPLSRLRKLRFLSLLNLRADDKTLAPLFSLTRLETFLPDGWSDPSEIDTIRRGNPKLLAAEPRVAADGAAPRRRTR